MYRAWALASFAQNHDAVPVSEAAAKPDRALIVVLSIIGALVVLALVVVFASGEAPLRDAATPEGVVQRYSDAVIAGDEEAAAQYLTQRASEDCTELERPDSNDIRVTLVETTEREQSADVRVSIVTSYPGGLFGADEYEEEAAFDLDRVDDEWKIDEAPWQLTICHQF